MMSYYKFTEVGDVSPARTAADREITATGSDRAAGAGPVVPVLLELRGRPSPAGPGRHRRRRAAAAASSWTRSTSRSTAASGHARLSWARVDWRRKRSTVNPPYQNPDENVA